MRIPLLLLAALSLFACSASDSDDSADARTVSTAAQKGTFACDNRGSESTCADYWSGATGELAAATCDGIVLDHACPKTNAIATCAIPADNPDYAGKILVNTYYTDGATPQTDASAAESCELGKGTLTKL